MFYITLEPGQTSKEWMINLGRWYLLFFILLVRYLEGWRGSSNVSGLWKPYVEAVCGSRTWDPGDSWLLWKNL